MTELVKETLYYLFVSMAISAVFAPIMIHFLYAFGQVSGIKASKIGAEEGGDNSLFRKIMNTDQTNGTPNMGGILVWLIVPLVTILFVPLTPMIKVLLIGFGIFGFWGLLDQVFANSIKDNEKLKALQETFSWRMGKMSIAILLNILVIYLLYNTGMFNELTLLNAVSISIVPWMTVIIGFLAQFALYAAELTDGLDGLMVGIFGVIVASMTALLLIQGQTEFIPILMITLGVISIDLYFNIPPARFWNGGPGAMPLGFMMFYIGLVTDNVIPYLIMSSITWIILASSVIQILSFKFLKRRVFKIAPLHHHFQAVGWPKEKVTMRFWLFTVMACMIGLYVGLI